MGNTQHKPHGKRRNNHTTANIDRYTLDATTISTPNSSTTYSSSNTPTSTNTVNHTQENNNRTPQDNKPVLPQKYKEQKEKGKAAEIEVINEEQKIFELQISDNFVGLMNSHTNTLSKTSLREMYTEAIKKKYTKSFYKTLQSYILQEGGNILSHSNNKVEDLMALRETVIYAVKFYFKDHAAVHAEVKKAFERLFGGIPAPKVAYAVALYLHTYLIEHFEDDLRLTTLKQLCGQKIRSSNVEYDTEQIPSDLVISIKQIGGIETALKLQRAAGISIFPEEYMRRTVSRITCANYNFDNEKYMISKIHQVFGTKQGSLAQVVNFHKSMAESKKIMAHFSLPHEMKIDFQVNLFPSYAWPTQKYSPRFQNIPLVLKELQPIADAFASYIRTQKKTERLSFQWHAHSSTVHLTATFLPQSPTLVVTLAQALILLAFSEQGDMNLRVMAEITGIADQDFLQVAISPLASGPHALLSSTTINLETRYVFEPNNLDPRAFDYEVNYAVLAQQALSEIEDQKLVTLAIVNENKILMQCFVVRTAKREKRISFEELYQLVILQFPTYVTDSDALQETLNNLMEREFLHRIDDVIYEYVP